VLDIAYRNSERLTQLINDLLDMEKIVAGKMHFDLQTQALMPLVDQALEACRHYGEKTQVRFIVARRDDAVEVRVDGLRVIQMLSNLLSNAAKFSPMGETVEISVRKLGREVRVEVRDHGPGISPEFSKRIFQKFSQADSSDTRQKGGTGLGLAITKELAEHMGGKIGFESVEGRGAMFYMALPIVADAAH
jgi:signal transduction histidine kinase